jgi:hypothetical protein
MHNYKNMNNNILPSMKQLIHQERQLERFISFIHLKEIKKQKKLAYSAFIAEKNRKKFKELQKIILDKQNRNLYLEKKIPILSINSITPFHQIIKKNIYFKLVKEFTDGDSEYIKKQKELTVYQHYNQVMNKHFDYKYDDYYSKYDYYHNEELILSTDNYLILQEQYEGVIEPNDFKDYKKKVSSKTYKDQHKYNEKQK